MCGMFKLFSCRLCLPHVLLSGVCSESTTSATRTEDSTRGELRKIQTSFIRNMLTPAPRALLKSWSFLMSLKGVHMLLVRVVADLEEYMTYMYYTWIDFELMHYLYIHTGIHVCTCIYK